jgi:hypothetical protein
MGGKFRELVLFVAERCAGDPSFGDTHLNKILFFSDAYAVQHLGHAITGAHYQKLEHGPAARALIPARQEMIANGEARVEMVGKRRITQALRRADLSLFSADEIELVERVIGLFRGVGAVHVSHLSHELSPGWNLMEIGEDIPLETQLLATGAPDPSTLDRGRELAARFGW